MYRNLNSLAMQLTRRGGLLMTCSCSGAMTQSGMFLRILQASHIEIANCIDVIVGVFMVLNSYIFSSVQSAASMAGRKITVVRQAGAGCDHPIDPSYPEGEYLSNVLLRVL